MKPAFVFILAVLLPADMAHAAAMLMRIQQMKEMKQRQAQMQYEAAYQQYLQQTGQASASGGPRPTPQPVQQTYQQKIQERNQAIAQAILDAHQKSASAQEAPPSGGVLSSSEQKTIQEGIIQRYPAGAVPDAAPLAGDTVDLSEVWKKLDTKSMAWTILADDQAKLLTVSEYIDRFHKQGAMINEPPAHYAQEIDQLARDNPKMLEKPFGELIQVLAIVDYDFDNGMDKDQLARKVLGEEGYEQNKKRFSSGH